MYGGIAKNNYTISMQNFIQKLTQAGHSVSTTTVANESLITRARNTLAHKFMKSDFDALLFIDADHGWDPNDVIKMIESGKDFIGAIYPMKGINWENIRLAALAGAKNLEEYSGYFAANVLESPEDFKIDEPMKIKDVGTGMMFITRKVFEDLKPICKTYVNNNVGTTGIEFGEEVVEYFKSFVDENKILLSEDYAFCRMWQGLGNDVYAAPWVRITHSGDYTFSGQFHRTLEVNNVRAELAKREEAKKAAEDAEAVSTEEEKVEPSE